jgi:hypothetical protein
LASAKIEGNILKKKHNRTYLPSENRPAKTYPFCVEVNYLSNVLDFKSMTHLTGLTGGPRNCRKEF